MAASGAGGNFEVHNSDQIAQAFVELQRQATREGRGEAVLQAARLIYENLRSNPEDFGEPLYRLPAMRMHIRCAAIRPLSVDFAICEDHPLVFIKAIRLLSARPS